jgi:putative tricarboxylic transport membrane protein
MPEPSSGAEPEARAAGGPGDRIAGAVVLALALLLWVVVIPDQIDAVAYGWMRPQTLPSICAAALGLLGALLLLTGGRPMAVDAGQAARLAALLGLLAAAVWAMARTGFVWVAPPLAAVLVVLLGERRWPWALAAVAGAPAAIWIVVAVLLNRPLP